MVVNMKRIKELFSKFINIKLSLKLRILSLFLIIILLAFSVVSYILTYSDLVIDFETDSNYRASGIYDDTVIVNDLESDYNYYMGLNYTTSSSNNTLPTTVNKNIYNDSNLVQVKITYSGNNYQDTKTSYVSLSELQNKYIYYKTYPVNNNNTTDTSDDYVEITLIDNPFTYLPNDLAFNFWITDYSSAVISYDDTYYERKVKIPITYTNNKPDKIEISFKTSYTTASVGYTNSSFTNAFSYLKDKQMTEIETTIDIYEDYPMNNYYHPVTINRNGDCSGYYNQYGTYQQNCTCRTNWWSSTNTCTYYKKIEDENFDINATYYYLDNGYMTLLDNSTIERVYVRTDINENFDNSNMAGFYTLKTFNNGDSITGYYDNTGNSLTGTCTSNTCSYYNLEQYYKDDNSLNIIDTDTTYYYLVTRDTNYIVLNETTSGSWSSNTKPFTLTSVYNGESYIDSSYWNVSSNSVNAYNDMKVQNIKIDSSSTRSSGESTPGSGGSSYGGYGSSGSIFVGNWHNVKFGRGIVRYRDNYTNFSSIIGGNSSSTGSRNSPTKYKLIIESGFYNSLGLSTGSSGGTDYIEGIGVYGSDYDRVSNNNSLLDIRYCASGSWAGSIYSSDNIKPSLTTIVKSGTFGSNKYDYAAGIYVGGRNSGTHYAPRSAIIEGGYIYNLIGGPLTSSNRTSYNDTFIYMKGGSVDIVIGGAGRSETYGNRIIQVTGGVVNYSVFGGSNGIEGSNQSNSLGTIDGDTFVYIGGNAVIGDEELVNNNTTETESQVEAGSVFGIGNGRESTTRNNYEKIGSANNSNVIIDGNALIRRNVYAGGNFGAVGINSSSSTTESNIFIHGGIIKGSVYGGGNNNGSGSTSVTSTVNIEMTKGVINGSLYGGSNQLYYTSIS